MIDMRVRQNHGIQIAGIAEELLVLLTRFRAMPLKQAAIEKNTKLAAFDEVLAAGHFLGGTMKCDLHERGFPFRGTQRTSISIHSDSDDLTQPASVKFRTWIILR